MAIKEVIELGNSVVLADEVRSGALATALSPNYWHQERVGQAVIHRGMDPDPPGGGGSNSAYAPFPIRRVSDGRIIVYVKEESPAFRIVAFDSADGVTFSYVGNALLVSGGGAWDSFVVSEPCGFYDEATDTIYMLYKGSSSATVGTRYNVGFATALASAPITFTRGNSGNPILLQDTVAAALGIPVDDGVTQSYLWSEDIDKAEWKINSNTAWTAGGTVAITDAGNSITLKKMIPTAVSSAHRIEQALPAMTDNTQQRVDFRFKASGYSYVYFHLIDKANVTTRSWVNVSTGTVGTKDASHTLTVTPTSDGYRVTFGFNVGTGGTSPRLLIAVTNADANASNWTGDGTSGVYIGGAHFRKNTSNAYTFYLPSTGTLPADRAPNVYDHGISSIIKIGTTYHAYGYIATIAEGYRSYRASGSALTNLVAQALILSPPTGYTMAFAPCVFKHPTAPGYCMIYTQGVEVGTQSRYHLRCAYSLDAMTWTALPGWFKIPDGGWTDQTGYEGRVYAARFLMESQDSDGTVGGIGGYDRPQQILAAGAFYFYYSFSGSNNPVSGDKVGLLRVRPFVGRDPAPVNLAKVYRNTTQSITSGVATSVLFNGRLNMRLDDMVQLDVSTPEQTTIVIREAGLYQLSFHVSFAASAAGTFRSAYILVGSGTPALDIRPPAGASVETALRGTALQQMAAGDTVLLRVTQDSGGALNIGTSNLQTTIEIRRVGD